MNNTLLSFISWFLVSSLILFIAFYYFNSNQIWSQDDYIAPQVTELPSRSEWVVLEINDRYQEIFNTWDVDLFLSNYRNDLPVIKESLLQWDNTFIFEVEWLDNYVPFLLRCGIFAENLNDVDTLRQKIDDFLVVFLLLEWWDYDDSIIQAYNQNFMNFVNNSDFSISEFFTVMNSFEQDFNNTEDEFASRLANLYWIFYSELQQYIWSSSTFNCEQFFADNVFWFATN